jgi:predicted secreted protein
MKKKSLRSVKAVSAARTPARRLTAKKAAAPDISPDEALHLEQISNRYAEAERAWLRMTAPPDGDDTWTKVEEHLLTHAAQDSDRRWKFFSK